MENKCSKCGGTHWVVELREGSFICLHCFMEISKKELLTPVEVDALLSLHSDETILRIVSWNSHYGLNLAKYQRIMKYGPQLLIIQECRKSDYEFIKNTWNYKNWYNDDFYTDESEYGSENGIAIFSNDYKIEFTEIFNRKYRYIIPYEISNNGYKFVIFIVWVKPFNKNYTKHLYEAVNYYREKNMLDNHSLIIGDFNTFAKDEKSLEILGEKLKPLINTAQKTEDVWKTSTYYHGENNYGINDFCFASKDINDDINVSIPSGWDKEKRKDYHWNGLSDHAPIIINYKIKL